MKKNIYICFLREESEIVGILNKIKQQCIAMSNLGIESKLIISRNNEVVLYKIKESLLIEEKCYKYSKKSIYKEDNNKYVKKISSNYRLGEFLDFARNVIESEKPDSIYMRRICPITFKLLKFIKFSSKYGCKVFWEIPTYSSSKNEPRKISYKYDRFMTKCISRFLYKKVGIAADENIKEDGYIFITNGVNIKDIKVKQSIEHKGINLICVATFDFWHGYDRLIKGLGEYYKNNNNNNELVYLHMVGNGNIEPLKSLTKEYGLEEYVKFHGLLTGKELDKIFDYMDIAIGNLGFHRVGVYADTSIKIREYCARGIPFVSALKDSDFPKELPFLKKVPADETPININSIIDFYNIISKKEYRYEMRKYAEENLTWEKKMSSVINHINKTLLT